IAHKKGVAFNLNQKIYKRFGEFDDFQVVMLAPTGHEAAAAELKRELGQISQVDKWHFAFGREAEIHTYLQSLGTPLALGRDLSSPHVFIIDEARRLRGRQDDDVGGTIFGFDATSVSELNNKMVDDVNISLPEYRLALKKTIGTGSVKEDKIALCLGI